MRYFASLRHRCSKKVLVSKRRREDGAGSGSSQGREYNEVSRGLESDTASVKEWVKGGKTRVQGSGLHVITGLASWRRPVGEMMADEKNGVAASTKRTYLFRQFGVCSAAGAVYTSPSPEMPSLPSVARRTPTLAAGVGPRAVPGRARPTNLSHPPPPSSFTARSRAHDVNVAGRAYASPSLSRPRRHHAPGLHPARFPDAACCRARSLLSFPLAWPPRTLYLLPPSWYAPRRSAGVPPSSSCARLVRVVRTGTYACRTVAAGGGGARLAQATSSPRRRSRSKQASLSERSAALREILTVRFPIAAQWLPFSPRGHVTARAARTATLTTSPAGSLLSPTTACARASPSLAPSSLGVPYSTTAQRDGEGGRVTAGLESHQNVPLSRFFCLCQPAREPHRRSPLEA
ncbi:hypothetical protein DFH06DRAFT_1149016 [Mycena polygramma]|nr:hypothetical protein DFH06DRAFT_1149016 [Mycena polygramma]